MDEMVKTILLIAGIVFLAVGGIIWVVCLFRPIDVRSTEVEIAGKVFSESGGKIKALVRIEVDGKTEEHWSQPADMDRDEITAGNRVPAVYVRRRVLGLSTWRIYLDTDAAKVARSLRSLYLLAGAAMILPGAVLVIVALKVFG